MDVKETHLQTLGTCKRNVGGARGVLWAMRKLCHKTFLDLVARSWVQRSAEVGRGSWDFYLTAGINLRPPSTFLLFFRNKSASRQALNRWREGKRLCLHSLWPTWLGMPLLIAKEATRGQYSTAFLMKAFPLNHVWKRLLSTHTLNEPSYHLQKKKQK